MSTFPLLLAPIVIYNILAIFGLTLNAPIVPLPHGIVLTPEEMLVAVTLIVLSVDVWRSTVPTPRTAKNHVATLLLFVSTVVALVALPWCATGTFLLLAIATGADLVVGTYVSFALKGGNVWVSNR